MKKLGYSLTWETTCFIDDGCNAVVYAHTNGYGDFVLFDDLGYPWPVHDCYTKRKRSIVSPKRSPYKVDYSNVREFRVCPVDPNEGNRSYNVIGTITNIERGAISKYWGFRDLDKTSTVEIKKKLAGRTSIMTIVDGSGREFAAFFNGKEKIDFCDIVACRIKTKILLNTAVFVVSKMENFQRGLTGS